MHPDNIRSPNGAQTGALQQTDVRSALPAALSVEARLKMEQVEALVGWGRSKIYQEIKAGNFPQPERRGVRCSRWRAGAVLEFLNSTTRA